LKSGVVAVGKGSSVVVRAGVISILSNALTAVPLDESAATRSESFVAIVAIVAIVAVIIAVVAVIVAVVAGWIGNYFFP